MWEWRNAIKDNEDTGLGYTRRERFPTTRSDILWLLQSHKTITLVQAGNTIEMLGYIFKWEHILSLHIGLGNWARDGIVRWINIYGYKRVTGTNNSEPTSCHIHGFIRCLKISTMNSTWTIIGKILQEGTIQASTWHDHVVSWWRIS